ncbi:fimbrial outer membrane usher protein [Pantoea stewartii]|uniref:fimbrial outer membrane usher protein n=1 Tax=Pantoea stewartii TaxID=66269 RepID=UPI00128F266A
MIRELKSVKTLRLKLISPKLIAFTVSACFSYGVCSEEYYFDSSLFQGATFGKNLEQFNQNEIAQGNYLVDIYLNSKMIKSGVKINFRKFNDQGGVEPCLSEEIVTLLQIKTLRTGQPTASCRPLSGWTEAGSWRFDQASLRLHFTLPMASLNRTPRGYIPVSEWDEGVTALFLRHNTNFTWSENRSSNYRYEYLWSGITAGTNLEKWQFRHQGNMRYLRNSRTGSRYQYNQVRSWVQRPLEGINSQLALGDNYTSNSLFGSLAFNGIKLASDERMWPQGKRGYAPEVQGVATSDARVIVRQLNNVIYETSVPPGPFVIDDLYNTSGQGDLEVEVIEANGKRSTFTVPYSSVPDSVRPGNWTYGLALGRVRQYYSVENTFFEGVLQRGISNRFTATAGSRLAKDYQAWLAGGVWGSPVGAVGMNTIFSQARVEQNKKTTGWRAELSYSKTFETGTNLVLAAYRYSTSGFRDLQDVLGVRRQNDTGISYYSDSMNQRNRLSATLGQSFDDLGMFTLSASTADYYNNKSRITQLQLGYNNNWKKISYGFNVARQRTTWNTTRSDLDLFNRQDDTRAQRYTENTFSFNISMPLAWNNTSSVSYYYNQSKQTRSSSLSLSGSAGDNNDISYSVYGGSEHYRNGNSGQALNFGGNVQQNTRLGAVRANYGQGENYRQAGLGASGTVVLHRGGITLGPYSSETFALVQADGAQGALVRNGQGAVIDRFGYAILPSLSAYRENNISLDTLDMNADAELSGGSQRVVPYAGAVVRINFATIKGKAVLISLTSNAGETPPMGAEVRDADNTVIGVVGQGGQLYARVPHDSGTLKVSWDNDGQQTCLVNYQITGKQDDHLIQLTGLCNKE